MRLLRQALVSDGTDRTAGILKGRTPVRFFWKACAGKLILAEGGNRDLFVFVLTFITYLLLSWSGEALPAYEYAIALLVAAILYLSLGRKNRSRRYGWGGLSPKRWGLFVWPWSGQISTWRCGSSRGG